MFCTHNYKITKIGKVRRDDTRRVDIKCRTCGSETVCNDATAENIKSYKTRGSIR